MWHFGYLLYVPLVLDLQSTATSHLMIVKSACVFVVKKEINNNNDDDDNNNNNKEKALSPEAGGGKMKPSHAAGDCVPGWVKTVFFLFHLSITL